MRFVINNMYLRVHVQPHRIALEWVLAKRSVNTSLLLKLANSQLPNPSHIKNRFCGIGEDIALRHSERHTIQTLYCNSLLPEKANQSFKRAGTDLLNGLNVSAYDPREIRSFKSSALKLSSKEIHRTGKNRIEQNRLIVLLSAHYVSCTILK